MVDIMRVRKKRPFKESVTLIGNWLNEKGEISVRDLVLKWGITPHYSKTLLQWAAEFYPYSLYDETLQSLYIPERRPIYKQTLKNNSEK